MAFIKYHQRPRSLEDEVSISTNGVLSLGHALSAQQGLKTGQYLSLLFDADSGQFALLKHPGHVVGAAKVSGYASGLHCSVRGFVREFGIKSGRYQARWDEQLQLIVCQRSEQPA